MQLFCLFVCFASTNTGLILFCSVLWTTKMVTKPSEALVKSVKSLTPPSRLKSDDTNLKMYIMISSLAPPTTQHLLPKKSKKKKLCQTHCVKFQDSRPLLVCFSLLSEFPWRLCVGLWDHVWYLVMFMYRRADHLLTWSAVGGGGGKNSSLLPLFPPKRNHVWFDPPTTSTVVQFVSV